MFTPETFVDAYFRQTKTVLNYAQPDAVKTALLAVTDSQEAFVKAAVAQAQQTKQSLIESFQNAAGADWATAFFKSK
jgi:hypothetical protein